MKKVKRVVCVMALCAVGFSIWWMGMNYSGYCHAEGRYLSDDEKIRSAVQYVLNRYPPTISKKIEKTIDGKVHVYDHWYMPENPIKYKNVDEFLVLNPGCCELSMTMAEGLTPLWIDRVSGIVSTYVLVLYKVRYLGPDNIEKHADGGMGVAIQDCGKAWSGL